MVKIFLDVAKAKKKHGFQETKKFLSENTTCYVLLACSEPTEEGEMQVEMSYEGDEDLACYLLDSAKQVFVKNDSQFHE